MRHTHVGHRDQVGHAEQRPLAGILVQRRCVSKHRTDTVGHGPRCIKQLTEAVRFHSCSDARPVGTQTPLASVALCVVEKVPIAVVLDFHSPAKF
jgi:hypothetical protein